MTKPMGVDTYKVASELPNKYKNILPDKKKKKKLLQREESKEKS